jgi:hypothetical protein
MDDTMECGVVVKTNGFDRRQRLGKDVTTPNSLCKHVYMDVSSSRDWMLIVLSITLIS